MANKQLTSDEAVEKIGRILSNYFPWSSGRQIQRMIERCVAVVNQTECESCAAKPILCATCGKPIKGMTTANSLPGVSHFHPRHAPKPCVAFGTTSISPLGAAGEGK